MNKKIIWSIVAVLIVAAIVAIVNKKLATQNASQTNAEPIKLGAVISLTGFAAPWGEYAKNGMQLAVKDINEKGGIDGRQISLVIEDDHTDGKTAVSAYTKLTSVDHVDGVLAGVFDFTAQPLIPLALANKLPLISASNFRIAGGFDLNSQSFVMLSDFDKVIRGLKTYLDATDVKKLAVVHYKSTFGNEIAKTLDAVAKEKGLSGIMNEEYAAIGGNDWKTTIIKLKSAGVDSVFLDMVGNDPVNFLKQAKQLGFAPKIITYNGVTDSFADAADKSLLENVVVLNWEVTTPEFADMYRAAYNVEATKSADKWFNAVYVLAEGIAKSSDDSKAASYIESHQFTTPNGVIIFTKDHAVENTPIEIDVVKAGKLTKWVK